MNHLNFLIGCVFEPSSTTLATTTVTTSELHLLVTVTPMLPSDFDDYYLQIFNYVKHHYPLFTLLDYHLLNLQISQIGSWMPRCSFIVDLRIN